MPISANVTLVRQNLRLVKRLYPALPRASRLSLRELTRTHGISIALGDISLIDGNWYVTHVGLLRLALRRRCLGIRTVMMERQSDPLSNRWVFKATVFRGTNSKGYVGFGDADPSNVSPLVRGAEMRVDETRADNRALLKAYGIGLCSVEELGSFSAPVLPSYPKQPAPVSGNGNGSSHGQPRLRDQLCLLIRQFNLDPTLVKAYAADFCGTEALKEASRDLVESFIAHISKAANEDRSALICKLNSYAQSVEVKP